MTTRPSTSRPFEALANPYRRQLLFALFDENPGDHERFDPLELLYVGEPPDDADTARIALHHHHLPKLADMGYLEWEQESGRISTGPQWDHIVPLLEVIDEHHAELPEEVVSGVAPD